MINLVAPAELRILVAKRVEAVRAGGDDLLHLIAVERGDVFLGQLLKQEFVADSACRVARALLLATQNGELDAGLGQQLSEGAHDLLIALDQRAAAADP